MLVNVSNLLKKSVIIFTGLDESDNKDYSGDVNADKLNNVFHNEKSQGSIDEMTMNDFFTIAGDL